MPEKILPPKGPLFLCHSHRDKGFVRRLPGDLRELSAAVWFDELELLPGESLHDKIGLALEECKFVGIVLSPDSVNSRWCKSELQQALAKEKRTGRAVVVPLVYRRVQPPPFLEDRVYIDFRRSYWRALTCLVAFLTEIPYHVVAEQLAHNQPKNLKQTKVLLRRSGIEDRILVDPIDFERLAEILRRHDISVGRSFVIAKKDKKLNIVC